MATATHVTPGRHTRLILDIQGQVATRPPWMEFRRGAEIRPAATAAAATVDVILQASGCWMLAPHREDYTRLVDVQWAGAIPAGDVNLAPHWGTQNTWRRPDELPGIGAGPNVAPSGVPAFWRRTPAGASWAQELTADVAAMPKPVLASADFPMDRVLSGKITYPANQAFALMIGGIGSVGPTPDTLCTFYFGGPSDALPVTGSAAAARAARSGSPALHGARAITVRGNGALTMYERTLTGWKPSITAPPAAPLHPKSPNVIAIIPTGPRDIVVKSPAVTAAPPVVLPPQHPVGLRTERPRPPSVLVFRENPRVSGYVPQTQVTGPGNVRLDARRGLRIPYTISVLKLPADGTLVDLPFWCPYPIPDATELRLSIDAHIPTGCTITADLYDALTDTQLLQTGNNVFLSTTSQAYYVVFSFTADALRRYTPVLYAYRIEIPGAVAMLAPVSVTGGNIRSVSTTGPDIDGQSDTANLQIQDLKNQLPILRARSRIPARVAVLNDAAVITTILHEGEVSLASGTKRGKPGRVYPSPDWYQFDVTLVGMWVRLAGQISLDMVPFGVDFRVTPGPSGVRPAWKITDIIRFLLIERAGFPPSQVDVPDLPIRLHNIDEQGNPSNEPVDNILQPGVAIGEYIQNLCQRYLLRPLVWCPNSGADGMWRLLRNPTAATAPLAAFVGGPAAANRLPVHPASYPAGTAPILHDSFRTEPKPPEGNFVVVVGAEMRLGSKIASSMYNPVSAPFPGIPDVSDPTHIDYLGYIQPILIVDTGLITKNATSFLCKQVFNFACHGQLWLKWRAPLVFVTDPADALQTRVRPLRLNDVVLVYGQRAVIHGYNVNYTRDGVQLCDYEAVAV